ncbi:MAG: class I SAM-dependent methyltransferase, partial [Treponema sp.]|nr:class I SAM-dependent methyltransferase [Treponema sp.]
MATEIVLHDGLATLGFPAKAIPSYADKLERYCAEIALFNDTCHLVKASSRADILALHVFDSLAGAACIRECLTRTEPHGDACIGDIGSGGGFPGIPLAVVMPDVQFELVERMATRCAFLENCVAALGLKNVRI